MGRKVNQSLKCCLKCYYAVAHTVMFRRSDGKDEKSEEGKDGKGEKSLIVLMCQVNT